MVRARTSFKNQCGINSWQNQVHSKLIVNIGDTKTTWGVKTDRENGSGGGTAILTPYFFDEVER